MTNPFPFSPSTEPARTMLFWVSLLTGLMQIGLVVFQPVGLFVCLTAPVVFLACGWGLWSSWLDRINQMSKASFLLFGLWIFAGTRRLFVTSPDPSLLLWLPMIIVGLCMGVIYLYLRKVGRADE